MRLGFSLTKALSKASEKTSAKAVARSLKVFPEALAKILGGKALAIFLLQDLWRRLGQRPKALSQALGKGLG